MWHGLERGEVHTEFWWDSPREGDHLEDASTCERIILQRIFTKWDGRHGLDCSDSG
jgi:hypothetical protein